MALDTAERRNMEITGEADAFADGVKELGLEYALGPHAYQRTLSSYWEWKYKSLRLSLWVALVTMVGSLLANAWMIDLVRGCQQ